MTKSECLQEAAKVGEWHRTSGGQVRCKHNMCPITAVYKARHPDEVITACDNGNYLIFGMALGLCKNDINDIVAAFDSPTNPPHPMVAQFLHLPATLPA